MDDRKLSATVLAITLLLTMFSGCLGSDNPRLPSNEAPVADIQGPTSGWVGDELVFNASGSTDDGGVESLAYSWHLGDGDVIRIMGPVVTHAYSEPGDYTVNMTVSDAEGVEDTASMIVTVHERVTVQLSSPSITQYHRGITCWDAVLNINKLTPKDEKVQWTEIRIVIKDSDGDILNGASEVVTDDSAAYANPVTGATTDVEFWFVDISGDGKIGAGDAIKITGMSVDYEGANVEITFSDHVIGSATLPTDFP